MGITADASHFYTSSHYALLSIFRNLFVNALEASKTDTVNLSVTEVIEDGQAIFTVTDDGPGIPADKREEVFKAFYRLEGSRNKETGGVGLGLSIAKDIITSHGGKIELLDSPIGGLRVLVSIPL